MRGLDEKALAGQERPLLRRNVMKRYVDLFKQTWKEFSEDKAQRLGAALAYYAVFSIAPLLLIAIAIAGAVFGQKAAEGALEQQLAGTLGASTARMINEMVLNAARSRGSVIATVIGIAALLFGAAGVFGQLQEALDTIWNVVRPKSTGFMGMIKDHFLSMTMVFGIGFLLLVSLVVDAVISAMGSVIGAHVPGGAVLLQSVQLVVSFGLVTLLFALIFRYLPHIEVAWRDVWSGALFTAILFVLGKFGLGLYIAKASVGSAFGAAGSLIVILIWVYWSAQILFFGAEFTQVYARRHGSMAGDAARKKKRIEEPVRPYLLPAPAAAKGAGGKGRLAAGGIIGLILGALLGGVTAVIVAVKSVKKLLAMPFK